MIELWVVASVVALFVWGERRRAKKDTQEIFEKMQAALQEAQLQREEHEEYLHNSMAWLAQWGTDARETVEEFKQIRVVFLQKVGDA